MPRPRHPRFELERILRSAEARGWRVTRGAKYYRMLCPCPEQHARSLHLTPSDPRHGQDVLGWLQRCACWKDGSS